MQIKKSESPINKVFGAPAPTVEYVAPPKMDEKLSENVEIALTPAKKPDVRPSRGKCSYCGAWEHTISWSDGCPSYRVEYPDPFWCPPDETTP